LLLNGAADVELRRLAGGVVGGYCNCQLDATPFTESF
jgi:hypothetical protein